MAVNYATYVTHLWADSDEYLYTMVREIAQEYRDSRADTADALKEFFEEIVFDGVPDSGLQRDLLNSAFEDIAWYEWADDLISKIGEEE